MTMLKNVAACTPSITHLRLSFVRDHGIEDVLDALLGGECVSKELATAVQTFKARKGGKPIGQQNPGNSRSAALDHPIFSQLQRVIIRPLISGKLWRNLINDLKNIGQRGGMNSEQDLALDSRANRSCRGEGRQLTILPSTPNYSFEVALNYWLDMVMGGDGPWSGDAC